MKILCDLTPIRTEKVERGRYVGQETRYRLCIAGDNWSWNIARINLKADGKEYPAQGQTFHKGFSHLLSGLQKVDVDPKEAVPIIIGALEKSTGSKFNGTLDYSNLENLGDAIDNTFKTNYLRDGHNDVRRMVKSNIYFRVLKASETEKEEE
jgi:hypothetical protein